MVLLKDDFKYDFNGLEYHENVNLKHVRCWKLEFYFTLYWIELCSYKNRAQKLLMHCWLISKPISYVAGFALSDDKSKFKLKSMGFVKMQVQSIP